MTRMGIRHGATLLHGATGMTYINWSALAAADAKRSLWQRIHWERVALLALNFGIWAMIAGLFT